MDSRHLSRRNSVEAEARKVRQDREFQLNNASLDAFGNRMELRSNRIIIKKIPVREAILFRRSRIKRSVV